MNIELSEELNQHFEKLKRLRELQKKEPNNTYHYWEKDIARCEHNIVSVVEDMLSINV